MNSILFKETAVNWIGKIPQNWEIKRLKNISYIGNGGTPKPDFIFTKKMKKQPTGQRQLILKI